MEILDTPLFCLGLRTFTDCDQCAARIPVNRLGRSVRCPHCDHLQSISLEFWRDGWLMTPIGKVLVRGKTWEDKGKRRWLRVRRRLPRCPGCKQELSEELLSAAEPDSLSCPECGACIPCRAANKYARKLLDGVLLIIGEGPEPAEPVAPSPAPAPVVFQCMQCGGALKVDGSHRKVRCGYCESDNFLPEELWTELHPRPVVEEIFLVARPEPLIRWILLLHADPKAACEAVAKAESLPSGVVRASVLLREKKVLVALARRQDLTEEEQLELAKSSKKAARELAHREHLAPAVLKAIRKKDI